MIVDDEPLAQVVIESYLERIPEAELVAKCDNALEAFQKLQTHTIDLMFLDIQMPKLTGIDFLKTVHTRPKVIITTAYREYAIEGYELDILDYLVKPISFERFLKAVEKYQKEKSHQSETVQTTASTATTDINSDKKEDFIFVKENKKMVKINLCDILYIESIKDYVKIYTTDKSVITKQQISYFEEKFDKNRFLRVHRSFIVAVDKIEAFSATSVEMNKKELPIGRSYKTDVMKILNPNESVEE